MTIMNSTSQASNLDRLIGRVGGHDTGPTLIIVAGIHGNEKAGVVAAERVYSELKAHKTKIRGTFIAVRGNLEALKCGQRHLEADLNRDWYPRSIETLMRTPWENLSPADRERHGLMTLLQPLLQSATGPIVVIDLHTTSNDGAPFITLGDQPANLRLGLRFPATVVLGLEEILSGTMTHYMGRVFGATTMAYEGGQHHNPQSARNHEALIWLAMHHLGILCEPAVRSFGSAVRQLAESSQGYPRLFEVLYRHAIDPTIRFHMTPGFRNFDRVHTSQIIGQDCDGTVRAPLDGMLLMPLYQGLGDDGFFIGRQIRESLVHLSLWSRRLGCQRLLPILPGIRRAPGPEARIGLSAWAQGSYPASLFRFLGFRRRLMVGQELVRCSR